MINDTRLLTATDESRRPSSKTLKSRKPVRKSTSSAKSQDRLVGGADVPEQVEDAESSTKEIQEESAPATVGSESALKTENGKTVPSGGPCCVCLSQLAGPTGYKYHFFRITCETL